MHDVRMDDDPSGYLLEGVQGGIAGLVFPVRSSRSGGTAVGSALRQKLRQARPYGAERLSASEQPYRGAEE